MAIERNNLECFFVTDLHGQIDRYEKLFKKILEGRPNAVFIGGDLLPSPLMSLSSNDMLYQDFVNSFLAKELKSIQKKLGMAYPELFIILGNDDGRMEEAAMLDISTQGIWTYCHSRHINWEGFSVYGYSFVPPTPFRLKDWERYDVSRYIDPGCIAPMDGVLSMPVSEYELEYSTISEDLEKLTVNMDSQKSILLFHSPPYNCKLDRAALDGKMVDYAPLDVHVGSIAIQRFIEEKQPLITLHGHIHESARITGSWKDQFSKTVSFNGSHDGPELSLIRFNPNYPKEAVREII